MAAADIDLTGEEADEGNEGSLQEQLQGVEGELQDVTGQIEYLQQLKDQLRCKRDQLLRRIQAEARAPKADWQNAAFPWDAKLKQTMQEVFGLHGFRHNQREVMNATLQGRDVLCLLPSGGGKSLCYQLPALVQGGTTLVVSPLLSLIQDQVCSLTALGVCAASLTSLTGKEEGAQVYGQLERGELRLLYVTPEKVVTSKRFLSKLEKVHKAGRLSRIAIDEAHCCSSWGNDFRPDYKKLGVLKQQFPATPLIALTATATHQVCEDLKSILRIEGCELFRSSVNRPNLLYEVAAKPAGQQEAVAALVDWIRTRYPGGESGIVYCLTRKDCEAVSADLRQAGLRSTHYHADMEPGPRMDAHTAWSEGRVQVMVATVAFGMGINKPDVRFVVHHSLSKSVENYYQESGRAGRDGLPAHCLLYYRFGDALRQAAIVCFEPSWRTCLEGMMGYAAAGAGVCRRALIQRHFAEAPAECSCMCDNCLQAAASTSPPPPPTDITDHALALLAIVRGLAAAEKKATLLQLVDAWRGGGKGEDASASAAASAARAAKAMSREGNEGVVAQLVYESLLEMDFGHTAYATNTYLRASSKGLQLLEAYEAHRLAPDTVPQPKARVLMPARTAGAAAPAPAPARGKAARATAAAAAASMSPLAAAAAAPSPATAAMRSSLDAWRQATAHQLRVFPHCIMSCEQLGQVAGLVSEAPGRQGAAGGAGGSAPGAGGGTLEQRLAQLLGSRKAALYGKELVEVLEGRYVAPAAAAAPSAGGDPWVGQGAPVSAAAAAGRAVGTGGQQQQQQQGGSAAAAAAAAAVARSQAAAAAVRQAKSSHRALPKQEVVVLSSDDDEDDDGRGKAGTLQASATAAAAAAPPRRAGRLGRGAAGNEAPTRRQQRPDENGAMGGELRGEGSNGDEDDDDDDEDDGGDDDFVHVPLAKRSKR